MNPRPSFRKFAPFAAAVLTAGLMSASCGGSRTWKPARGPLFTRWGVRIDPNRVLPEYPRPRMVRKEWRNLNGPWEFEIPADAGSPVFGRTLPDTILVPFPVESALSGVMKRAERVRYRRSFDVPRSWAGRRVLLHFGAVDWRAAVYVNGRLLAEHLGGYDSFSVDATCALAPAGGNELIVDVFDPSDGGGQPRGKQVRNPEGIWYTPSTGIWRTVWMEPVPDRRIESYSAVPDVDAGAVVIRTDCSEAARNLHVQIAVLKGGKVLSEYAAPADSALRIPVPDARLWSPEDPFLYGLRITLMEENRAVDAIAGYFAMRKISIGRDAKGAARILLNGRFTFRAGTLDQGFWPDGGYTAPSDEALRYDIEALKRLGFTLIRKHVKVEPDRWYYWTDRLGMLVWQDMPSGSNGTEAGFRDAGSARRQFETELLRMVETHAGFPSIVMWVVFNEGWGQFDTERLTDLVRKADPSRLVNAASGWTDTGVGDVADLHRYPGPDAPAPEAARPAVLGEFGGLGLAVPGHTWRAGHWGYRDMTGIGDFNRQFAALFDSVRTLSEKRGLSAAIYTQTTDVETEVNGLLTYDRETLKLDPAAAREFLKVR
jgi:beta-galactosidase/beta-glucuronidase